MNDEVKNIHNLWPLNIGDFHNDDHPQIKEELLSFFKSYEKKLPDGNSQLKDKDHVGNHNLYQSNYDLHNEDNEILKKLFHFIAKSVLDLSKIANQKSINKLSEEEKKYKVNINESWFIRYNKGGIVYPHHHDGFSWSCVYYVQTGKEAKKMNGSTYFLKPYHPQHPFDFGSNYMQKGQVTMEAEEGKLLVFPGYLFHGSHPFYGEDDRIIISVNSYTELKKN